LLEPDDPLVRGGQRIRPWGISGKAPIDRSDHELEAILSSPLVHRDDIGSDDRREATDREHRVFFTLPPFMFSAKYAQGTQSLSILDGNRDCRPHAERKATAQTAIPSTAATRSTT
jgi:hypothetical protein